MCSALCVYRLACGPLTVLSAGRSAGRRYGRTFGRPSRRAEGTAGLSAGRSAGRKYAEPISTPSPGTVKSGGRVHIVLHLLLFTLFCIYFCSHHLAFTSVHIIWHLLLVGKQSKVCKHTPSAATLALDVRKIQVGAKRPSLPPLIRKSATSAFCCKLAEPTASATRPGTCLPRANFWILLAAARRQGGTQHSASLTCLALIWAPISSEGQPLAHSNSNSFAHPRNCRQCMLYSAIPPTTPCSSSRSTSARHPARNCVDSQTHQHS